MSSGRKFKAPKASIDRDLNYPLSAQMANVQGSVLVGVFVDESGAPEQIKVVRSSGNAELDSAAVDFAGMISYEPATLEGKAFGSWTHLELRYQLTQVNFDKQQWLADVLDLQKKASVSADSYMRNIYLQRLYLKYLSFAQWAQTTEPFDVQLLLKHTTSPEIFEEWQDMLKDVSTVFVLFLEFYQKYPDCEFIDTVKESLTGYIINAKTDIRLKASEKERFAPRADAYIERLEKLQLLL